MATEAEKEFLGNKANEPGKRRTIAAKLRDLEKLWRDVKMYVATRKEVRGREEHEGAMESSIGWISHLWDAILCETNPELDNVY